MRKITREVVEIDKEMRDIIKNILEEKEKIPEFLHAEKEKISLEERQKAEDIIEKRKQEIEIDLKRRLDNAKKEYTVSKDYIDKTFNKYREEWVKEIFEYCISE